jgi:hypothetical protein
MMKLVDDDELDGWRDDLWDHYLYLREQMPEDAPLDFSPASLRALQELVRERFDGPELVGDPGELRLTLAVAAYVGETLLRAAGGGWGWQANGHEPLAVPDPALGLATVNLLDLITATVAGGERFEAVHAAWAAAARQRAAEKPGWTPAKEPTELDEAEDLDPAALPAWLATRAAAFPGGAPFDFTAASLPAVEDMVRSAAPTKEQLRSAEHRELYENAAWYVGEVLRRGLGGEWVHDVPGPVDVEMVALRRVGRHGSTVHPGPVVVGVIGDPGWLSRCYGMHAG